MMSDAPTGNDPSPLPQGPGIGNALSSACSVCSVVRHEPSLATDCLATGIEQTARARTEIARMSGAAGQSGYELASDGPDNGGPDLPMPADP